MAVCATKLRQKGRNNFAVIKIFRYRNPIPPFTHSLIHSFTHSLIDSLTHSLIHSLTNSPQPLQMQLKLNVHLILYADQAHHLPWRLQVEVREAYGAGACECERIALSRDSVQDGIGAGLARQRNLHESGNRT